MKYCRRGDQWRASPSARIRYGNADGGDGRWRWRTEDAAVVTAFSEVCREITPPPDGVPVLLVRAALNPRGSERLAAAWSDLPAVRIETVNCGHHLLTDRPAQVAGLIAEFLATPCA